MRRRNSRRGGGLKVISILFFLGLVAGAGYVYTASEFERELPTVQSEAKLFWNRTDPLKVKLADNEALKSFEIILSDGKKSVIVEEGHFETRQKEKVLEVKYPQGKGLNDKATRFKLKIVVTDSSLWNFLQGNKSEKILDINVDYKRPNVNVLANSYSITQGGSALVVFQAEDDNLAKLYIEAGGRQYQAQPYKREGYYASLIAWPFNETSFVAKVVAIDKAENKRIADIHFYLKNKKYRVSWIQAKDKFIDGKITELTSNSVDYAHITDRLERLRAINETMRLKNEEMIHALGKEVSTEILDTWKMKKFYPLRNGQRVASYGDERHYYYKTKDNQVSHSYHVGYDLASTKMAVIKTSNAGKVVYANDNGIYGNMPMIDHGLGLYSLYGHCSQLLVNEGDELKAGQAIAKTGVSGLALGDHLHFGLLVQGLEVRPVEWFDQSWIRKNIDNVFKEADKIILGK